MTSHAAPHMRLIASPGKALTGRLGVPGDKSMSHRALMLGGLADGESRITGLLQAEDIESTAGFVTALGAQVTTEDAGESARITGWGEGVDLAPARPIDCGNSGTTARLGLGLAAGLGATVTLFGDTSLARRPMARVLEPLARLGAKALARPGGRLPLTLSGPAVPKATAHSLGVASAQVKSALLLASLRAQGEVVLTLPQATRDHTERLLALAGVEVEVERTAQGGERVAMQAPQSLKPFEMSVPGDISAAAFPLVAALITPGSMVELDAVSVNPTRTGLLDALQAMGAALRVEGEDTGKPGEPSATLTAQASSLEGIDWPGEHVALMVDEYPVLAAACALARGRSRLRGLAELRVKESDRLTGTAALINACGGTAWVEEDDLLIDGTGGEPLPGGAVVEADGDHRMAMSACVLGLACRAAVTVTGAEAVATSWPGFVTAMQSLGADLAEIGP